MYADVTTESDPINKMGNKALAWQINLYGLSSLWAMNRDRMCVCCLDFLIKLQKDLNAFDKQDEHEPVIRACYPPIAPQPLYSSHYSNFCRLGLDILIEKLFIMLSAVQCSVIVFCQHFNQMPGNAKNADSTDYQFCFCITQKHQDVSCLVRHSLTDMKELLFC